MRFRRFAMPGESRPVVAAAVDDRWIPIRKNWLPRLPADDEAARISSTHVVDALDLLAQWDQVREPLQAALRKAGDSTLKPTPDASALLPFEPRSYRDFMLYERHVVDAARGYARRFLPAAYRIASAYESLTKRTFPAFRPHPLWQRQPIYYMGNHLAFVGDGVHVRCPDYSKALDYELELGFVLARPLLDATPQQALAAIGGFVVFNDFSARDVQLAEMRSGLGPQKAKHFCSAMSAELVSADEILPRVDRLAAEVRINGRQVCATSTQGMHFSIGEVLAHASRSEQLHPGEFFGTGTLPGGSGMENGVWLNKGDEIELRIDGVGSLRNTIT